VVFGKVTDIRSPIVTVEIYKLKGLDRGVAGDKMASLHISNLSSGYTEDIRSEVRIGDIVQAKVTQVHPSIQLTTVGRDLGVVRAHCITCRKTLERRGKDLYCSDCDRSEPRTLSDDYDNLTL
ncbi:MAG: exosome complex RNA-binding protein Csl4, partial [Thermoplasmata archaeon]|nr:exosome complex RNA-binding protein Csl4 [Thermoplasmata archaeon]